MWTLLSELFVVVTKVTRFLPLKHISAEETRFIVLNMVCEKWSG